MKVLLLSAPASAHTRKWAKSLAENGLEIAIFGLSGYDATIYQAYPNIQLYTLGLKQPLITSGLGSPTKLRYLGALPEVRKIIRRLNPDIVHAHFATSYGLLGALSRFQPYILSVWGSDIFDFPGKSFLHKALIKYNLDQANKILSTSFIMAAETRKYTNKEVEVTPFGIDLDVFKPCQVESLFDKDDIVIGTVKALEKIYGIEYLIRAFKTLKDKHQELPLKLLIVGDGSQKNDLKKLSRDLGIDDSTIFTGHISYDQVPYYHNMLSIFVSLSIRDSFGVAAIEASACERAVVVSNVGGLPEVVEDGVTGFVVPPMNPEKAAEAIEKLVLDLELRRTMGRAGRARVKKYYDWNDNVHQMINIYERILS